MGKCLPIRLLPRRLLPLTLANAVSPETNGFLVCNQHLRPFRLATRAVLPLLQNSAHLLLTQPTTDVRGLKQPSNVTTTATPSSLLLRLLLSLSLEETSPFEETAPPGDGFPLTTEQFPVGGRLFHFRDRWTFSSWAHSIVSNGLGWEWILSAGHSGDERLRFQDVLQGGHRRMQISQVPRAIILGSQERLSGETGDPRLVVPESLHQLRPLQDDYRISGPDPSTPWGFHLFSRSV